MVRDLHKVLEMMIQEVPAEQEVLRAELSDIYSSVVFAAPERLPFWWREVAVALQDHITHKLVEMTDWQVRLSRIWFDREEGEPIPELDGEKEDSHG
jgi:hypothetical protein